MNKDIQDVISDMEIRPVSRSELCNRFNCSDRTARQIVSEIAQTRPVISLSDGMGYRIATKPDDIDDAMHAANENTKRAREILKRNIPLQRFIAQKGA